MKPRRLLSLALVGTLMVFSGNWAEAGLFAKAAARVVMKKTAEKQASNAVSNSAATLASRGAANKVAGQSHAVRMQTAYQRDRIRDAKTSAKPLAKDRVVQRYTSANQARVEAKMGLGRGIHTTSTIARGRPLSRENAQARYGLKTPPGVRTTWVIPAGTKVKLNKVVGGTAGVGELRVSGNVAPANRLSPPVRLSTQAARQ